MEDNIVMPSPTGATAATPVAAAGRPRWRDLREWLKLVEDFGSLRRIRAEVDPNEELAAVALMTATKPTAPALLFERFANNPLDARVLTNILGASKERYALAV